MNDLDLLDRFGPSAPEPSDAALAAARARLSAALDATTPGVRRTRRLPLLVAASVVAAGGAGIAVAPALMGSDHSIALAAVDPLTFPVTPTWLPAGLGDPVFSKDSSTLMFASYGRPQDGINVVVSPTPDNWEDREHERAIEVRGHDATVFEQDPGDVVVVWKQDDGDYIGVSGRGDFADEQVIEHVAESVADRSQRVDLFLTVAPAGWQVQAYQSDMHVSYGERGELSVTLLSSQADPSSDFGAKNVHDVSVDGRTGWIGNYVGDSGTPRDWVLVAPAPDGREFVLQAPGELSEDQVIEIAAGVRHR
ncbi:hypothetical protein GCM10011584_17500 [Nocardioides phosphati]|uniref:DUF4367 domain-containing protein n=1 Tax=Nocardioides phosphati TaxID=1867775 RepID=A0ABQ2N9Q8_9ACTN|nr:hypothetical protein [Nocardioides phosphati]GGO89042.1 hypothetical protein GCM10011584_17500 [Nocardioides phosphati]